MDGMLILKRIVNLSNLQNINIFLKLYAAVMFRVAWGGGGKGKGELTVFHRSRDRYCHSPNFF